MRSSGPKEKRMCGVVDGGRDKETDKHDLSVNQDGFQTLGCRAIT